jgi:hypothetical protein
MVITADVKEKRTCTEYETLPKQVGSVHFDLPADQMSLRGLRTPLSSPPNTPSSHTGHKHFVFPTIWVSSNGVTAPPTSPPQGGVEPIHCPVNQATLHLYEVSHGSSDAKPLQRNLPTPPPSPERAIPSPSCGHPVHPAYFTSYNERDCV